MLFYEIINDHPAEDPALICQDKMLTYGEVREEVTLWAAHLQSSGVCKGDKVGLFSKNCNEFVIAYLAIIKAGGVVVPFNFQLAAPEVAYIVQDAGMRVMVTRQKLELDAALQECGCGPLKQLDFEDLRQPVDRSYEDIALWTIMIIVRSFIPAVRQGILKEQCCHIVIWLPTRKILRRGC